MELNSPAFNQQLRLPERIRLFIPSNYQGSDSFHNPNNIRIFDLRRSTPVDSALGRNVREWGAKLDARMVAGCTTLAPAGLRCNGISFIPADAGKTVICYGCARPKDRATRTLLPALRP